MYNLSMITQQSKYMSQPILKPEQPAFKGTVLKMQNVYKMGEISSAALAGGFGITGLNKGRTAALVQLEKELDAPGKKALKRIADENVSQIRGCRQAGVLPCERRLGGRFATSLRCFR